MFAILVDNLFYGFWGNKVGDVFIENTINNLHLDESKVKLLYFSGLWNCPEHFEIINDTLTIKIHTPITREVSPATDPVSFETVNVVTNGNVYIGEVFFENSVKLQVC